MPQGQPTNTGTHPKALWPGVHAFWGQTYNQHDREYPDLYDQLTSSQAYEQDVKTTGYGLAPIKPEGGEITYDFEAQGQVVTYAHIAYALGFIVTYEERQDNLYPKLANQRAEANAFSMVQTIENIAAAPYNDAFTGAVFLGGDAVSILNPAHPNVTGGSFSNALTPAASLMEASLEDISIQAMGLQNDRGMQISVVPQSLIIPRQEWFNANRILKSAMQADTVSNNINVLKATNAFPKGVKMNHYLTNPRVWFVRTNVMHGMQMFWREKPNFAQDNDFDTKNAKAASYMRVSVGNTDPMALLGSNSP